MPNIVVDETRPVERAQSHLDSGDLDAASSCLMPSLAEGAAAIDVAVRAAEAAMTASRFDIADRLYVEIIRLVPDNAILRLNHSYALNKLDRLIEACDQVTAACDLAPDLIAAQTFRGYLCHVLNRYDEAAEAFGHSASGQPNSARAWLSYAEALTASYSRFEEAPAVLAKTTALAADDQDLQIAIANLHLGSGRYAEAEALLTKVLDGDVNAKRSPMLNIWLGYVVRAQGRETEAATYYLNALAMCEHLGQDGGNAQSITYRSISAFVLHAMGKSATAEAVYDGLCPPDMPTSEYVYDHEFYLPHSHQRIERVTRLVGGRDIMLLLYGPSARELATRTAEFRDLDVCFASVNKFNEVERGLLAPAGRALDLVVSGNANDLRQRWPAFEAYLRRPAENMLMLTEFATAALPQPYCSGTRFVDEFDSKLLYFHSGGPLPLSPIAPLSFLGGNTLSITLPLLVLGGPRRIFIFGADGGAQPDGDRDGDAYFFGETVEVDASERRRREANRRFAVEARQSDHNTPFSVMAMAKLFHRTPPEIFNCCPHSNYRAFPRISVDEGLRLLRS